ncbi:unnamed protein product [Didymodactylos carnosus]|uniref:Reverse transcriptase domain-containing protein n=1 Tax=Didymodactylos carnosus TaxID=1234261 RepID=A0A8S2IR71_9BILA|nr:unnamed protein product [Didymodactylos carnosus]CAF3772308.1 unnamed protein product [Didymodactylos carnosus]
MKSSSPSLHGFMLSNGEVVKDSEKMCEVAAIHYEDHCKEPEVYRPHPYTDAPEVVWDNYEEKIPPSTVFVDVKNAFNQLWHTGCLAKLKRMEIPKNYLHWINVWLSGRRAFIEIGGKKSRWFKIMKGGPQGSIFTPTLFICYHSDMDIFLGFCLSHFDDLAAILAGSIGMEYTSQCLDLEHKLQLFFDRLEYYCCLAVQPINYDKTQALFSARAIGYPNIELKCGENDILWTKVVKYLGYIITPTLGFEKCTSWCAPCEQQQWHGSISHVHRGQMMSMDEFEHITETIGQYISINSFLSASKNKIVAEIFAGASTPKAIQRIIFDIEIETHLASLKGFAQCLLILCANCAIAQRPG